MWLGLWVLDWELFLSMGGEVIPPSELVEELAGLLVFPALLEAGSVSITGQCLSG